MKMQASVQDIDNESIFGSFPYTARHFNGIRLHVISKTSLDK